MELGCSPRTTKEGRPKPVSPTPAHALTFFFSQPPSCHFRLLSIISEFNHHQIAMYIVSRQEDGTRGAQVRVWIWVWEKARIRGTKSEYRSGYGRKPELEAPPVEIGSRYGQKPSYEEEPACGEEPPRRPSYGRPSYETPESKERLEQHRLFSGGVASAPLVPAQSVGHRNLRHQVKSNFTAKATAQWLAQVMASQSTGDDDDGDPVFEDKIVYATRKGTHLLSLSDFRDEAHSNS